VIFKQWQQILEGAKTQTRRAVKEGQHGNRWDIDSDIINEVVRWRPSLKWSHWQSVWVVGRTYAVQPGRGKKAVGRIRITKIRRERLGDISAEDIFAEGVGIYNLTDGRWYPITVLEVAREEYAKLWDSIYGKGVFERMKDDDVWVLEFERVEGL
jgi:uncharacterized protein YhfF